MKNQIDFMNETQREMQAEIAGLKRELLSVQTQLRERIDPTPVALDLAERTRAAAELQWKTAFLEAQVNSSLDGILVVDEQGRKILQNQRLADLLKIPEHIADDKDDEQQVRWVTGVVKHSEQFVEKVLHLYSHPNEISRDEVELKDGTMLDRYSSPVMGQDGKYYGRIWTFRDITERKQAEDAMLESKQRFSGAFEHAPIGIALVSPDGRWLKANRSLCDLVGYSEAELLTRNFVDLTHPDDVALSLENVRRALAEESRAFQIEKRYVHRSGHIITALLSISLIRDGQGQPRYFVSQIQDITARKQAEEALHQSEERFRTLVEQSPDVIGIYQEERLIFINSTGIRVFGYQTEAELLGRKSEEMIHPDDLVDVKNRIGRRLAGETGIYPVEVRYLCRNGSSVPMEVNAVPITHEGKPAVQFFARQITERKQAEQAVQRSQKRLRDIIDGLGPSIFVGLMSLDGTLLECNRPSLAAAGLTPEDVLGKPFEETYWWTHSLEIQQQLREAIARAVRGEASRYDVQIRAAENQLIDVDFSLQPLRDERGEVAFLVPSASVITERKQMENALRESNEKFHQLAGNITDAFWIRSPDMSEVHYVSPAFERIWGRSVASLHANPQEWTDFILPEDRARVVEAFAALRGDAPSLEIEYRIVRPNGEIRWIRVRGFQVRDAANKLIRHIGIVTDITESKLSEAALEKAHKELVETSRQAGMAEVATSVLHNVGNVLNSVNVASTCLADSLRKSKAANLSKVATMLREHEGDLGTFLTSDAKGKQIPGYLAQLAEHLSAEQAAALKELAQLQKNIEHIKDIVSMQQSFAKVSGATETLQVSDLVEDALRMNSSSFARHDIQVIKDFESMPSLAVEKHKVLQILVNLVRNAKHACDDSGRTEKQLTIRVSRQGEAARITISDNGIGIPSENLTRIFAHGFTTKKNGHGFGLHSSALAAKELGGSLSASSDGPDRGATFILELPLKHKAEGPLCAA